jgi:hypothetical protein
MCTVHGEARTFYALLLLLLLLLDRIGGLTYRISRVTSTAEARCTFGTEYGSAAHQSHAQVLDEHADIPLQVQRKQQQRSVVVIACISQVTRTIGCVHAIEDRRVGFPV